MCSRVDRVRIFAWTESVFLVVIGKSRNLSKIVSVVLSASVERFFVSRMRYFSIMAYQWSCLGKGSASLDLGKEDFS